MTDLNDQEYAEKMRQAADLRRSSSPCSECGKSITYTSMSRHRRTQHGLEPVTKTAEQRFMEHVSRDESGCWIWTGCLNHHGYGGFGLPNRRSALAHRWSYEHFVGDIPDDLQIDHLCRVRACVNPDHLEPVTSRENTIRGVGPTAVNALKTHCIHGHEFTEDNTYVMPGRNYRRCRACKKDRDTLDRALAAHDDRWSS